MAQFSLVRMPPPTLLAVPNISEGADASTIAAVGDAIAQGAADRGPGTHVGGQRAGNPGVSLIDVHSDADHDRSVFTFAGPPCALADAMLRLAREAIGRIDLTRPGRTGQHPHVGALDVAPVVYPDLALRGAACAEALAVADRLGEELGIPVFLYGELTGTQPGAGRTRAELRRGGVIGLATRMTPGAPGEEALKPDFGPRSLDPGTGATLVAARPPLVAFNLELAPPAAVQDARRIAMLVREGGEHGLPGVRAIGVQLTGGVAQVSMNVERPLEVSLAEVVAAVRRHAPVARAELVGLVPAAALEGFPEDLAMPGFDPLRQVIENALGC